MVNLGARGVRLLAFLIAFFAVGVSAWALMPKYVVEVIPIRLSVGYSVVVVAFSRSARITGL